MWWLRYWGHITFAKSATDRFGYCLLVAACYGYPVIPNSKVSCEFDFVWIVIRGFHGKKLSHFDEPLQSQDAVVPDSRQLSPGRFLQILHELKAAPEFVEQFRVACRVVEDLYVVNRLRKFLKFELWIPDKSLIARNGFLISGRREARNGRSLVNCEGAVGHPRWPLCNQ